MRRHITVRHDYEHRLGLASGDEIVQNGIHTPYLIPGFLRISRAAHEIKHGITTFGLPVIARRRINQHRTIGVQNLGIITAIAYLSPRNIFMARIEGCRIRHLQQTGFETFVGKNQGITRIGGLYPIDTE